MAKYKVLATFEGIAEEKTFEEDTEADFTVKRAEEINKKLKEEYGIEQALERIDTKE